MWSNPSREVSVLIGLTLASVVKDGDDRINFTATNGRKFVMYHDQNCCESVIIESIVGDLQDLVGTPILVAEERTSEQNPEGIAAPEYQDCYLWTFYTFRTIKGSVDIRWYGDSNGYYSVDVDFVELTGE